MRKILATFSGSKYFLPTQRIVEDAPKFGVDEVLVYDDHWLVQNKQKECAEAKWLFDHPETRGFGWFFWKSVVIQDALSRVSPGDVVLFTDADTYPIHDLSIIYQIAERDGIMLFASNGWLQKNWCTRACFRAMGITDDDPKYYDAQHGVARFMAFRAGAEENTPFLERWYKYCLDRRCNTFDLAPGDVQHKDFRQHRCEQAIMTNLAHERGIKLYREACQFGNTFDLDRDLYPQLFFQDGSHSFSPRPCVGSAFRNV